MRDPRITPDKYFPQGMVEEVPTSTRIRRLVTQALAGGVAMFVIGYLSANPSYTYVPLDHGVIKLSLSHAGERKEECVKRSAEELRNLAPNMRAAMKCSRARVPVLVEMDLDGKLVYSGLKDPKGLADDGNSLFYETFEVPAGRHTLSVRMRDSKRDEGFDYTASREVVIEPGQNFVIGFRPETGSFRFY